MNIRQTKADFINKTLPRYFYKSGFASSLYYTFFSKSFRREHRAVLEGKVIHLEQENNYFLLVQNTHRIEKGLLMRPRKKTFALNYIGKTIDIFEDVYLNHSINSQIKWFKDVLTLYFDSIELKDENLIKLNSRFQKLVYNLSQKDEIQYIPYRRNIKTRISFEDFYDLTRQRRSVRWFLDKPVPRELIDKAILAANQSPSACNRQPFEFRIFDKSEMVNAGVKLPMGTQGYAQNIPVFIVVVGRLDAYFSERDRHLIYIDASLANMTLMLALETLGLGSCPINWPDIEDRERKMESFLNINKYERPIMCIGLGFPDLEGKVAYSEKRPLNAIRKYN